MKGPAYQPTGTIGLATRDVVHSEFCLCLARLDKPKHFRIAGALNYDLAHARNFMVDHFEGEYLWLLDDDMTFEPDILKRLLAHNKPVIAPFILHRRAPFPSASVLKGNTLPPRERPGLIEVDKVGGAGALIHRSVFEAIDYPYFWHGPDPDQEGHDPTNPHFITDDEYFCKKVREAGFSLYCDTSVPAGHLATTKLVPEWHQPTGQWFTGAQTDAAHTQFIYEHA